MTIKTENYKNYLPLLVAEIIKRMKKKEKMELAHYISWKELEEWKAIEETLKDKELITNLRQGLEEERKGRLEPITKVINLGK